MTRHIILGDSDDTPDGALAAAYAALDQGQVHEAYDLAAAALSAANGDNLRLEARALACLAHCDRIHSRLRRASGTSRRAAQLFEQLGDAQGEANALTTLAHVCMLLGRNDEAVEAALLSVQLCKTKQPQPPAVLALNSLGLAYSWGGDHKRGDAALELAVETARRCEPAVSVFQPRINQVWVEASRLIDERFHTGAMRSLARLASLVAECRELERAGIGFALLPGLQAFRAVISPASCALLATWQGDAGLAQTEFEAARRALGTTVTWLDAFVRWCAAEMAWARQDWAATQLELERMRDLALSVEHEQLACRAHLLLIQVFELQGRHEDALRENRILRQREQRVVADSLSHREALVSWRLGARQSERHLQQALVASRQFERWSLEDALTGIANRRHLEQVLDEELRLHASAGQPLAVALLDIDQFKSINDRFTHEVGDRVLKTVAGIMSSQLRKRDLPARWAGDEFVIVFANATAGSAAQVCERVRSAITSFDWESIAAGLRVSVSIGLAEAMSGDTNASLLHRSDTSMYRVKPRSGT
ncbi:diguanylate cyclase (GGDEF)-like protein [Pseudacidovorax intermedius]|uniref:diguanylate cyclase n=1 Tax=Pseudacidovorax intermedius TaxID=433924 RepID=A0A370F3Y7_9BURK|nr:GGDEF domain-containing protein [Pseudacidovorax intermedius]RDI17692.1 diguanylate cyclase (GGDEF)-like protein [Pseudacidovorax intermedius]